MSQTFTPDARNSRFENSYQLQVTQELRADYQRAAEDLAARIAGDPAALARILPPGMPTDATARRQAFIREFGKRAYRRPLTSDEVQRYETLFQKGPELFAGPEPFADGVRITLEAFLQSPHFVYRAELSPNTGGERTALTALELASKLSYAVSYTMPDAQLLKEAEELENPTKEWVLGHAKRMLEMRGAQLASEVFHQQLLRTNGYEQIVKDSAAFGDLYVPGIGLQMEREALLFSQDVVFARRGGLRELLLSPRTFVNQRLAKIYGLEGSFDDSFQPVELEAKQRAGWLTQLGFLSFNAHLKDVDSIHRGVFVHKNILCTPLPKPPPNATAANQMGRTNRERITSITGPGTCGAGCHSTIINPVGFGFEHFDALGRYRTEDDGLPIDASGSINFADGARSWSNAVELSQAVAESREAHDCYAGALFEFVQGRPPSAAEGALVTHLGQRSKKDSASVQNLILELVTNDSFLFRSSAGGEP